MIREAVKRSHKLSRRLAEISRRRALPGEEPGAGTTAAADVGEPTRSAVGIEELLPGGVLGGPRGAVFVHERLRSEIERPRPGWGRLRRSRKGGRAATGLAPEWLWEDLADAGRDLAGPEGTPVGDGEAGWEQRDPERRSEWAGHGDETLAPDILHAELEGLLRRPLEEIVFLDLETGGLSNACVFLAGTMRWNGIDFVLKQFFARHYGEEESLIRHLGAYLAEASALITFNGKSFDVPFLKERAVRFRLDLEMPGLHVDLLRHARAAWRGRVPNCRLVTLEAYVCRRRRSGDVPGEDIPGLYHDFVRLGEPQRLISVFHHNLLDVITMDELLRKLI